MRLRCFDYFRAIAIVSIVMGHSYAGWTINSFGEKMFASLITGGTSLFVFISGFFFHNTFYKDFSYLRFINKKLSKVFVPYLAMSSAAFIISLLVHQDGHSSLIGWHNSVWEGISSFLQCIFTEGTLIGYWYVPFIMITFLISPLFLGYITCKRSTQIAIFLILIVVSMVAQRPLHELNPIHSLIYFAPMYLMGILFSINKDAILKLIAPRPITLLLIVLGLSALKVMVDGSHSNNVKAQLFSYNGFDVLVIQKIFLVTFCMSILGRFENTALPALENIASCSFAIYFIHPWALIAIHRVHRYFGLFNGYGFMEFVVTFCAAFTLSVSCAHCVRLLLKEKSRFVTGW